MKFYAIALRTKMKNPRVTIADKDVIVLKKKTTRGMRYFAKSNYSYKGKSYPVYKIINKETYQKLKK